MNKYLIVLLMVLISWSGINGQSFGIRAGLNYTKFSGPVEQGVNERFSLTNGFHFGVNYAYKFADIFSVKGELLYTQIGSKYNFDGDSYYKVPIGTGFYYEKGFTSINLKVSNAYVSLPITFQWELSKKLEVFAGGYVSYLVGPRGNGTLYFTQYTETIGIKQSLIHNYYSDVAGGIATSTLGPWLEVGGKTVQLYRDAGAYYNLLASEKEADLYKSMDYGLLGGFNYFINKGFYVGLRYEYGLRDVTDNRVDFIKKSFDEDNNVGIKAEHFDRNVGFEVSFGFRF
ncbi:MAG: outer membrane beta-barrel protein [Saprospiraceae bacterium]